MKNPGASDRDIKANGPASLESNGGCFFVFNSTFSSVFPTLKHSYNPPTTPDLSLQIFSFGCCLGCYDSKSLLLTTLEITFW